MTGDCISRADAIALVDEAMSKAAQRGEPLHVYLAIAIILRNLPTVTP